MNAAAEAQVSELQGAIPHGEGGSPDLPAVPGPAAGTTSGDDGDPAGFEPAATAPPAAGVPGAGGGLTDLPADLVHDLALDLFGYPPRDDARCDRCGHFAEPYHGVSCWKCWATRQAFNAYRG